MMAQMNAGQPQNVQYVENKNIAFSDGNTLPQGNWSLTITKGNAWVFCNSRNFVLDAGESAQLRPEDGEIHIRALYIKGNAHYTARQIR